MAAESQHPGITSFPSFGLGTETPRSPDWQVGNRDALTMSSQAELGNKRKGVIGSRVSRGKRPAGVILAAVLISLFVVMLIGAELTRTIMLHHRQTRLSESQQQSFWLAESALQRAVHALTKSPEDYKGETWRVPAEALGAGSPGVAIIQVEPAADPETGRVIRVQAYYPEDGAHRILHERELSVNSSSPGGSP